jgi:hypothetical protein
MGDVTLLRTYKSITEGKDLDIPYRKAPLQTYVMTHLKQYLALSVQRRFYPMLF